MSNIIRNLGLLVRQLKYKTPISGSKREPLAPACFDPRVLASFCANQAFSTINRTSTCFDSQKIFQQNHLTNLSQVRFRKRRGKGSRDEDEEDEGEDDDDLANENPLLVDDLLGEVNDGSQSMTIDVNSLRLDSVCKTGFSMARSKVEELFYKGDIYVNGELASKKSEELSLNDEVDVIKGPAGEDTNLVNIRRLIITHLPDKATEQGRLKIKIKRWLDLTVEPPSKRSSR